jgi:hypothetical protein
MIEYPDNLKFFDGVPKRLGWHLTRLNDYPDAKWEWRKYKGNGYWSQAAGERCDTLLAEKLASAIPAFWHYTDIQYSLWRPFGAP